MQISSRTSSVDKLILHVARTIKLPAVRTSVTRWRHCRWRFKTTASRTGAVWVSRWELTLSEGRSYTKMLRSTVFAHTGNVLASEHVHNQPFISRCFLSSISFLYYLPFSLSYSASFPFVTKRSTYIQSVRWAQVHWCCSVFTAANIVQLFKICKLKQMCFFSGFPWIFCDIFKVLFRASFETQNTFYLRPCVVSIAPGSVANCACSGK